MKGEVYLVKKGSLFGRLVRITGGVCHGSLMASVWKISRGPFGKCLDCLETRYFSRNQASEAVEFLERRLGEKGAWVKYKTPREIAEETEET